MFVAGILGVVGALSNLGAYVVTGTTIGVRWEDSVSTIALWDKLVVLVLGIVLIGLARTRSGPRWGRLIGVVIHLGKQHHEFITAQTG